MQRSTTKVPINGILKHVKIIPKKLGERAQENEKNRRCKQETHNENSKPKSKHMCNYVTY